MVMFVGVMSIACVEYLPCCEGFMTMESVWRIVSLISARGLTIMSKIDSPKAS